MATQNTAMDNAALIKEVNEAHKHKKYSVGYHAQTVVAVIVTLIMLFPLYWMIATSFKSAEECSWSSPRSSRMSSTPKTISTCSRKPTS